MPVHDADRTKIASFEALRGLLALAVFVSHIYHVFVRPLNGAVVTEVHQGANVLGRFAVLWFFVLSGYVIGLTIDANRRQPRGFSLGRYAASRAWRVAPPLLATALITSLLGLILLYAKYYFVSLDSAERMVFVTSGSQQVLALLTLTVAGDLTGKGLNGPLWSLAYEIQLYAIAGLAAWIAFGRSRPSRVAAALGLVAYLHGIRVVTPGDAFDAQRAAMFAAFGLGLLGYSSRRLSRRLAWGVALAIGVVGVCAIALHLRDALGNGVLPELSTQLLAASSFAFALVALQGHAPPGWMQRLGSMAYTLYILHFPLLLFGYFVLFNVTRAAVDASWAPWTGVLWGALTFAVCARIAPWVERPVALRRWVGERLSRLSFRLAD